MTPKNFPPQFQAVSGRIEVQPSAVKGRKVLDEQRVLSSDKQGLGVQSFRPELGWQLELLTGEVCVSAMT